MYDDLPVTGFGALILTSVALIMTAVGGVMTRVRGRS